MVTPGKTKTWFTAIIIFITMAAFAQPGAVKWSRDGTSYYRIESNEIVQYTLPANTKTTLVPTAALIPAGKNTPLAIRAFYFSNNMQKVLIYTNSKRVWRLDTQGDYWVFDIPSKSLKQLGLSQPVSSLRFCKFSPDGTKVAYVSQNDLFFEDLITGKIRMLTTNRSSKIISGTFDWAYEEEFACRDGFQWSPDSQQISFWQVDASKVRSYNMINFTDSAYSRIVPLEYPTVGQAPSPAKIGIANVRTNNIIWLNITGDPQQNYLPRMEWANARELYVQQLNRKQNESKILACNITGASHVAYQETSAAWIDVISPWENRYGLDTRHHFDFLKGGLEILWSSEKDGWRHLYIIHRDGKELQVTKGNFDVMEMVSIDEKTNHVYFIASPDNATQRYLYRTTLDGKGKLEKITPENFAGINEYSIAPGGKYAVHTFSNSFTKPVSELITLPDHKAVNEKEKENISSALASAKEEKLVEFFKVKTQDGIEMDGWVVKPKDFDPKKKYPVLFFVYTEPATQTVRDSYGVGKNRHYTNLREDGYLYVSIDNRGTPAPKGSAWRKSIYRKIGQINIYDQAMAAREILKWPYVDPDRVAVWGHSGGGAATLNLLFQYPDIYKTGIAMSAITNQLTYDNIYQERYMGLPQENLQDFIDGSPVTHAKNLKGHLLYIHGTGDDNVHYNNAEMLIDELVKNNKQFQFMPYPNRTHGIREGEGTATHLSTLFKEFLQANCMPGGR